MPKKAGPAKKENIPVVINIDDAVQHINELVGNKLYETAIEVGDYILITFFKNDINEVKSKNPYKSVNFKTLCDRSDLKVHPKHLYQMVVVAAQERLLIKELGEDKTNKLGYSLKVELLKIHEDKTRIKTAKKWITNPVTIAEAKKYIATLGVSNKAVSELIPLTSPFMSQLNTISEWTENDELKVKLEMLTYNKIVKLKEQIELFLKNYEPVKNKIDSVKVKIDSIYKDKKTKEEEKAAAPKKNRGRPAKPKDKPADVKKS